MTSGTSEIVDVQSAQSRRTADEINIVRLKKSLWDGSFHLNQSNSTQAVQTENLCTVQIDRYRN